MTNKLHFIVDPLSCNTRYETYDEAVKAASHRVRSDEFDRDQFAVYKLVAVVEAPVPEAIVTVVAE